VFTQEQVKRMRTFLFTHLGMSLRFDARAPGEWTIVRRNAPAMEHDPAWHTIIARIVRNTFAGSERSLEIMDVRPSQLEGAKALISWHWPGHDLNFRTKPNGECIAVEFDIPTTPPRVREGLLLDEPEPAKPAAASEPVSPPPPPTPAPKLAVKDDPSQDIPLNQYFQREAIAQRESDLTPEEQAFSDALVSCANVADKPNPQFVRNKLTPLLSLAGINEWELVMKWAFSGSPKLRKADCPPSWFARMAPEYLQTYRRRQAVVARMAVRTQEPWTGMGADDPDLN
jgi:hypothetical protein